MLSDEEKKAIKEVKHFNNLTRYWQEEEYEEKEIEGYITTVLNLIEKQSKEIEELKNGQIDFWISDKEIEERIRNKFVSKDKIKAKLEELENYYRELYKQDNSPNEFLIGQDCLSKLSILQEVKQSLLEKE